MTGPAAATDSALRLASETTTSSMGKLPTQRTSDASRAAGEAGTHILLVDRDPDAAQTLRDLLMAAGVEHVAVLAGEDCGPRCVPATGSALSPARTVAAVNLRPGGCSLEAIPALRAAGWRRVIALATDTDGVIDAISKGATAAVVTARCAQTSGQIPSGIYDLSPREIEVLRMVADGRSNKWIGDRLELSALTVKSHLARIGRKLGTGERAHMVALALRAGVIS